MHIYIQILLLVTILIVGFILYKNYKAPSPYYSTTPSPSPYSIVTDPDKNRRQKEYTLIELSRTPYISFDGIVYDVSGAANFNTRYGAYARTVGKDATFAFVNNCFEQECLIPDRSLNLNENMEFQKWKNMFERTYPKIGYVNPQDLIVSSEALRQATLTVDQMLHPTTPAAIITQPGYTEPGFVLVRPKR